MRSFVDTVKSHGSLWWLLWSCRHDPECARIMDKLWLSRRRAGAFVDPAHGFGMFGSAMPPLELHDRDDAPSVYFSALTSRPFWPEDGLTALLKANVDLIRDEFKAISTSDHRKDIRDVKLTKSGWTVFSLLDGSGNKIEANCARCPKTTALVESLSGMNENNAWTMAYFSIMAPGTHLRRHMGPGNLTRRYHLGLEVPERDSYLMVHDRIASWRNNECIVFDDSYKHEVFHQSDQRRVVFIVDIPHPELTVAERDFFKKLAIATQGTSLSEDVYVPTDAQHGAPQS